MAPTLKQASLPQFGFISGGVLDGWGYALGEVRIEGNAVVIEVLATPLGWPFPTPVALLEKDFKELVNHGVVYPQQVAHEFETQQLIDAAVERARTGQQQ